MKKMFICGGVVAAICALVVVLMPSVWTFRVNADTPPPHPVPANSVAPQLHGRPASTAFQQLANSLRGQPGNLPNGCVTLAGEQACVPPVSVDHQRLPDLVVLSKLVGVTGEPGADSTSLSSPQEIHTAIAAAVFDHLLYVQGVQDGYAVSHTQAEALAQQELTLYQHDPQLAQSGIVPSGSTPEEYFLSAQAIAFYGRSVVVGQERQSILRGLPNGADPTPQFRNWLAAELAHHDVTVNGTSPTFTIADALPTRP